MTDAKLYVTVVTLSTQDNAKLLQQIKLSFKRTINWNEYLSKVKTICTKSMFRLLNCSKIIKESIDYLYYHLKMKMMERDTLNIIFQK